MEKNLRDLLTILPNAQVYGSDEKVITMITCDSRQVEAGSLFICLAGAHVDGHDFIQSAYNKGAVAVLTEKAIDTSEFKDMTIIQVKDTREVMQQWGPMFYDFPSRKMRMIGVTGTNGKTTTTYLLRKILTEAGYRVGVIGTIQTMIGEDVFPVKNTTPDVLELQKTLAEMVKLGIDYVVMEVSSHALALGRVAGCEYDVAVFTNLSQDHLDFHETFENYQAAKRMIFEQLTVNARKEKKVAIINMDDPVGAYMKEGASCSVLEYGIQHHSGFFATNIEVKANGTSLIIHGPAEFGSLSMQLQVTGMFNVYNVLGAIAAAWAEGIQVNHIQKALEMFTSVPGRFELVSEGQRFAVIVDYAHTPDGLENILKTAQEFVENRIITIFGCGGDRDRTKRPIMGRIAALYSDVAIATSDNPRTEDPEFILSEIEQGILENTPSGLQYIKITDRRQAIRYAIEMAEDGDVILIAGKGHETYQILKEHTIDFDDREVAREILRERKS